MHWRCKNKKDKISTDGTQIQSHFQQFDVISRNRLTEYSVCCKQNSAQIVLTVFFLSDSNHRSQDSKIF